MANRSLVGIFAPHIPTPRMQRVFGATLDNLVPLVRLPKPDINDSAVMDAVRVSITFSYSIADVSSRSIG